MHAENPGRNTNVVEQMCHVKKRPQDGQSQSLGVLHTLTFLCRAQTMTRTGTVNVDAKLQKFNMCPTEAKGRLGPNVIYFLLVLHEARHQQQQMHHSTWSQSLLPTWNFIVVLVLGHHVVDSLLNYHSSQILCTGVVGNSRKCKLRCSCPSQRTTNTWFPTGYRHRKCSDSWMSRSPSTS